MKYFLFNENLRSEVRALTKICLRGSSQDFVHYVAIFSGALRSAFGVTLERLGQRHSTTGLILAKYTRAWIEIGEDGVFTPVANWSGQPRIGREPTVSRSVHASHSVRVGSRRTKVVEHFEDIVLHSHGPLDDVWSTHASA